MTDHPRHSGRLELAERREFLPFLHELAAVSAAVIRPFFMQLASVETKPDESPVTAADRHHRLGEGQQVCPAARQLGHLAGAGGWR